MKPEVVPAIDPRTREQIGWAIVLGTQVVAGIFETEEAARVVLVR